MRAAGASAIGIDLGGTNVRVALVDGAGCRLAEHFCPTPQEGTAEALLERVAVLVRQVQGPAQPIGVGLGVPGALDAADRLIAGMTNLPVLACAPLAASLSRALGLPIRVDNDARAAMLGEARYGAARGIANALMLTLGTGIGGGLMLDGRVRAGPHGLAGEICLSPTSNADGDGWVALEDLASPGGLRRTAGVDVEDLARRADAGDTAAAQQLDQIWNRLAAAIVTAHVTLDLEMVVLAGGMTRMGALLLLAVRAAFARLCPPAFADKLTIELSCLGPWAGAMGAAALCLDDAAKAHMKDRA